MGKKLSLDDIKLRVINVTGDEYEILEYVNTNTKSKFKHMTCCNEFSMRPTDFFRGQRCPICSGRKKLTTEDFKNKLEVLHNKEYTVLGEYVNYDTKILIKHNVCNYEYNTTPANMLTKGTGCPKCNGGVKLDSTEFKIRLTEKFGNEYELLEDYVNTKTKIKFLHKPCNNIISIVPNVLLSSTIGCQHCANLSRMEKITKTNSEFKENVYRLVKDEYVFLEDYINTNEPILVRHNTCNKEYCVSPNNFLNGLKKCPYCSNSKGYSNAEKEIVQFIQENYNGTIIENDRIVLEGKELDIYLPELKIAIEFNGIYWHSEQHVGKQYHLNKTEKCLEQGITLVHIFENEWVNSQEIVKSKIKYLIKSKNDTKIYARKCFVEEIDNDYKRDFLNSNHIQGTDNSNIKLGLWYPSEEGDILVAVMTFCKPRISLGQRSDTTYDYELSRFATEMNYNVIGSFGKLFKYFKDNYKWDRLITYADRRYSKGNIYIQNGFNHLRNSAPNYFYFSKNVTTKLYHRYNFRKNELSKKFPNIYEPEKTEYEIMVEAGYDRIWDCGNMVFEYTK